MSGLANRGSGVERAGSILDGLAIGASATCLVHCLALPLLFALLPALGRWVDPHGYFHLAMLAFALPTSALALIGGWWRHHNLAALLLGPAGLVLMTLGVVFAEREIVETILTVSGSLMLASAHIANWKARAASCH
ncbi:MerC domain-containing protein [Flavisphingomonas formosensis]|uniref:MerC domain-containing protein n=1 Tax=Flavisphingomonas formosensis TaxID=861534 RepID=UPI0012F75719|nr:MerC domain-containing protein [Sphingomonas formosensis]